MLHLKILCLFSNEMFLGVQHCNTMKILQGLFFFLVLFSPLNMSNISDHSADIYVEHLLNKLDSSVSCTLLTRFLSVILERWT